MVNRVLWQLDVILPQTRQEYRKQATNTSIPSQIRISSVVYYVLNQNTILAQAQRSATANGAPAGTVTSGLVLIGFIFGVVFIIILYLVVGVVVSLIAGLIGKGRAPQPTAAYQGSMYSGLPPTPPTTPAQ